MWALPSVSTAMSKLLTDEVVDNFVKGSSNVLVSVPTLASKEKMNESTKKIDTLKSELRIIKEKSLAMLKIAYDENPNSHYILDSLAWGYYKKNDLVTAVDLMEEVIKRAPGEAISLDHLGDIYFALGRKREAYFMWNQAKDLAEPEDEISDSIQLKLQQYNAG